MNKTLLLVAFLLFAPGAADAQFRANLVHDDRVRVTMRIADSISRFTGNIIAMSADTLTLGIGKDAATAWLPRNALSIVERSEGRKRLKWAIRTATAGALIGGILLAREGGEDNPWAAIGFLAGAFAGTIMGAPLGAAFAPEEWVREIHVPGAAIESSSHRIAISEDTRVRYSLSSSPRRRSQDVVSRFTGDTLQMTSSRVAMKDLASLQVRGGKNRGRGMAIGATVITLITAAGAIPDRAKGNIGTGEMLGAFSFNAVLGAGIGWLAAPAGWLTVPLPPR
jgi:hypothetical protein